MTKIQSQQYQPVDKLIKQLSGLAGQKFVLSCGHHVTFNQYLANDIVIYNDKDLRVVCLDCGS
jgi:hypothetical protein